MHKKPTDKPMSALGAEGGKARAKSLTKRERGHIAREAAKARWGAKLPRALRTAPLQVAGLEFECAVLDDKDHTRVVSETRFMAAMGMYRSGAVSIRRAGAPIPLSLAHKNLKPYVEKHLGAVHFEPLKYINQDGGLVPVGIPAQIIPKICEVWIDADRDGVLGSRQKLVAQRADILFRGFAHVGIVALIDEATGWQYERARDALAQILEAFVSKELKKWVRTFPVDYFKELCRLRGVPFPTEKFQLPSYFGHLTNNIVYDRIAPGVREELHRLTPRNEKGRLKNKLFQRLTDDVGHPRLREHLASAVALMKASDDWDQFERILDRALPRYSSAPLLAEIERLES